MSVTLKTVSNGITKTLQGMRQREKALQGFLNRNVLEQYRNLQRKRWMTENVSEDAPRWAPLDPMYVVRKLKKYRSYPGAGAKKLIATNRLVQSVISGPDFYKVVTKKGLFVYTRVPYAQAVDKERPFTEWSRKSELELKASVSKFLFYNELKRVAEVL